MPKTNTQIKKIEGSEVEITSTIPVNILEKHREKAVKKLSAQIEVKGFRKGHLPENILIQKVGEANILEEMAEMALREEYPKIITENKIDAIGRPEISITKIAKGNPLEFKVRVAVMPEVELADYRAIAKDVITKKENIEVTEKEIDDTIAEIRKMRAQAAEVQKEKRDEEKTDTKADKKDEKEEELPEINDEFVKTLGDFKDVEDFKEKLKINLKKEKERKIQDKKKAEIMEKLIQNSTISIPKILVESELDKMTAQFKDNVMQSGGTFEEYLKHIKKTEEEIRKEWRTDAEKHAKSQLIINKIAITEKIIASNDEIEKEVKQLLDYYKDADPQRARIHVETVLTNKKVFEFLENQK